MSHFRDRVILTPGNLPQLPSGRVVFNIGAYRISTPILAVDSLVPSLSVGTANATGSAFTAAVSLGIGSLIPGLAVTHTP